MSRIRHWIGSATLLLAPTVTFAQGFGSTPGPLALPPALPTPADSEPASLGGGTLVGKASAGIVPVARVGDPVPMVMPAPKGTSPTPPSLPTPPITTTNVYPPAVPGVVTQPAPATTVPGVITQPSGSTSVMTETWQLMLGANGPVGEDLYFRTGPSIPFGKSALAKNLDTGWNATVGGRSLFFNPEGSAAWVIDAHLSYTYNNASGQGIVFLKDEPTTIRALTRWGVGLGVGRDWFSNNPGFVMNQWDLNFSYGIDAGARWGTGHTDFNPTSEIEGYRRNHDIFGQSFVSLHAGAELPMGGWTLLMGGRAEWNYTFSDLVPANGSLHGVDLLFQIGVRY